MANKNMKGFLQEAFANIELEDFDFEAIPEIELPDAFIEEFHKKFLTATSAKNNPDIIAHFKARYLSSVDGKLKKALGEEKFVELQDSLEDKDTLKLVDKALEFLNSEATKAPEKTDNKDFENYKKQTIKEIQELKEAKEKAEQDKEIAVKQERGQWLDRYKQSKINEILSEKKFNSTLPAEDFKLLINQKINNGDYIIDMDDDLNFKIKSRKDPEVEVVKEGVALGLSDVLDEFSLPYLAKNGEATNNEGGNEGRQEQKREMQVTVEKDKDDGYFTPGHPNYKGAMSKQNQS